jgi:2-polyprenyl-3-methyl-5-hydroxy-6-metoxy-1,4-benzoquinol methylase
MTTNVMWNLSKEIEDLEPWHQWFDFNGTIVGAWPTSPKIDILFKGVDISGKSAIDIGCNAGAATMWMEQKGAKKVYATDIEDIWERQFNFVKDCFELKSEYTNISVYDIERLASVDVVLMMGIYYHLRHPLLGIEKCWNCTKEVLLIEGEVNQKEGCFADFYRDEYRGDKSNFWIPTVKCLEEFAWSLDGVRKVEMIHPLISAGRAGARVWR